MKLSRLMSKQSHGKVSLDIDLFAVWELMKYWFLVDVVRLNLEKLDNLKKAKVVLRTKVI